MRKLHLILFILTLFAGISHAFAANEYPTAGLLYNTVENSSLTYNCTKDQDELLHCEFIQTSVRRKGKLEDLEKIIQQARKQFPVALKGSDFDRNCEFTSILLQVISGKITPDQAWEKMPKDAISDKDKFINGIKELSTSKREDQLVNMKEVNEFCTTHTEESFLKIAKSSHEKDMKTCLVSSNPYKQNFRWVADYASGTGAWVVDSKADGPCGIVQLTRFESDANDIKGSKLVLWKYYAKKAITNPKGKMLLGSCSDLDEREYIYDWKTDKDYKLGCEYIEFSAF